MTGFRVSSNTLVAIVMLVSVLILAPSRTGGRLIQRGRNSNTGARLRVFCTRNFLRYLFQVSVAGMADLLIQAYCLYDLACQVPAIKALASIVEPTSHNNQIMGRYYDDVLTTISGS